MGMKDLKIGNRLSILLALLVLLLLITGWVGLRATREANAKMENQYANGMLPLEYMSNIEALMQANQLLVLRAITNPSVENSKRAVEGVTANIDTISKSLKLFLGSFRNHGAFHEDCTVSIARRIADEIKPKWLRIGGYWYPRGGIPIDVFYQTGAAPKDLWIPEQGVAGYRGRG